MDVWVSLLLPGILWGVAFALGRRELRQYRAVRDIGYDLFTYSKGRLIRRLTGVALLAALGGTLFVFGVAPPGTPRGATIYMALIVSEVLALIVLPLFDLWETARTARPADLTRQADRPPRTRSRPRNPP